MRVTDYWRTIRSVEVPARTQRFNEARRRGTDRALARFSVSAERRRCTSDFESDVVQPNTSFWPELKRAQRFLKRAIAYAVIAWLLMQITMVVFPFLGLWRNRTVCGGL